MKAQVRWNGGMDFQGKAESDVWVSMGPSKPEPGKPQAASPMELLLMALGGCTSMDIVHILGKKKIAFDDFWVELEADKTEEYPKVFSAIRMKFIFVGNGLKPEPLEQAVKLSADKYCSVGAMVKSVAKISHEVEIREK